MKKMKKFFQVNGMFQDEIDFDCDDSGSCQNRPIYSPHVNA